MQLNKTTAMTKIKIFFVIIFQVILISLPAQKIEMRVNAGTNLTFIPNFTNVILIARDGMMVPGFVTLANSRGPILTSKSLSETTPGFGFLTDLELRLKINDRIKFTFAAGLSQMRFGYDTYVEAEGTESIYLSDIDEDYGNTCLLYANLRPFSFYVGFVQNKLSLQFGPSFNILLKSQYDDVVVIYGTNEYEGEEYVVEDRVYFESIGKMSKVLYGTHIRADIKIIRSIDLFISGQYYFNSVYGHKTTDSQTVKESKPFNLQAGISFIVWRA